MQRTVRWMGWCFLAAGLACTQPYVGHAQEQRAERVGLDLALGYITFTGPTDLERGAALDVGLSWLPTDGRELLFRGALGVAPTFSRHSLEPLPRLRLEAAFRARFDPVVLLMGGGGGLYLSFWSREARVCPSLHLLGSFGVEATPTWTIAIDLRLAAFWDRRLPTAPSDAEPVGEAQLRSTWFFN